jgi:hypothetical protein
MERRKFTREFKLEAVKLIKKLGVAYVRAALLSLIPFLPRPFRVAIKEAAELDYWRGRARAEAKLDNSHYQYFYTTLFGLTSDDYRGKRVLDIGCGPRVVVQFG